MELAQQLAQVGDADADVPEVDFGTLWPISTDWTYERVLGNTCSTPRAPDEETSPGWKPDSIHASARTSAGSSL